MHYVHHPHVGILSFTMNNNNYNNIFLSYYTLYYSKLKRVQACKIITLSKLDMFEKHRNHSRCRYSVERGLREELKLQALEPKT